MIGKPKSMHVFELVHRMAKWISGEIHQSGRRRPSVGSRKLGIATWEKQMVGRKQATLYRSKAVARRVETGFVHLDCRFDT